MKLTMKLTKKQLKQIINEELGKVLKEYKWKNSKEWRVGDAAHARAKELGVHQYFVDNPGSIVTDKFKHAVGACFFDEWGHGGYITPASVGETFAGDIAGWFITKLRQGSFDKAFEGLFIQYAEGVSEHGDPKKAEEFVFALPCWRDWHPEW